MKNTYIFNKIHRIIVISNITILMISKDNITILLNIIILYSIKYNTITLQGSHEVRDSQHIVTCKNLNPSILLV